jgi:hypothetical protein
MPIIHEHRLKDLSELVESARLKAVWKKTVRDGLRKQTAPDLHDYLDIHHNLDVFCENIRQAVMTGAYRPREPDVIATEKGKGLLRHLLIPAPADALLLQSIADMLEPVILRKRPSKRAFYSRSHQRPDIENLTAQVTYPWWIKWAKFVEQIWEFRKRFPFLVVTDVANYFDNIDVALLRNRIAGFARVNEAHLDLLLYILDDIKAHGFYGSRNRLSLPQIDFDAPRLLATAYLFDADALLRKRTQNSFVRWMDDIDFGAKSREEAAQLIGALDRRLHGLNVRLNSGKTQILTEKEAATYFWITENIRVNKIKKRLQRWSRSSGVSWRKAVVALENAAKGFLRVIKSPNRKRGQWEKIYKRYLGLLGFSRSALLEPELKNILRDSPSLRRNALGYLRALGYTRARWKLVKEFIARSAAVDQAACLEASNIMIQWQVPRTGSLERSALAVARSLRPSARQQSGPFVAGLMILAKYCKASHLAQYLRDCKAAWRHSSWAVRQVASCLPLLDHADRTWVRERIADAAFPDATRVLESVQRFETLKNVPHDVSSYLTHHKDSRFGWPLAKFIVALAILQRAPIPASRKQNLVKTIGSKVQDPVYISRLLAAIGT